MVLPHAGHHGTERPTVLPQLGHGRTRVDTYSTNAMSRMAITVPTIAPLNSSRFQGAARRCRCLWCTACRTSSRAWEHSRASASHCSSERREENRPPASNPLDHARIAPQTHEKHSEVRDRGSAKQAPRSPCWGGSVPPTAMGRIRACLDAHRTVVSPVGRSGCVDHDEDSIVREPLDMVVARSRRTRHDSVGGFRFHGFDALPGDAREHDASRASSSL